MTLEALLRGEIDRQGPLPFARFMEACLYHPEHGYYTAGQPRAGAEWLTGPTLHPVLGRTLARGIAPLLDQMDAPTLVEAGAGSGELISDLAAAIQAQHPELAERLALVAVERSPAGRERIHERLVEAGVPETQVTVTSQLPHRFSGVLVSNELLDALPVHLCRATEDGLQELHVDLVGDRLKLVAGPVSRSEVALIARRRAAGAEPGARFEVPVTALTWTREAASSLQEGAIVTIDYGADGPRLLDQVPQGTVHGYRRGQPTTRVLDHPGEQDLTYLVPFDLVAQAGEAAGLETRYYGTQGVTLEGLGIRDVVDGSKEVLAAKKLIDPAGAGSTFQVLLQHTGLTDLGPWPRQPTVDGPGQVHTPWLVGRP